MKVKAAKFIMCCINDGFKRLTATFSVLNMWSTWEKCGMNHKLRRVFPSADSSCCGRRWKVLSGRKVWLTSQGFFFCFCILSNACSLTLNNVWKVEIYSCPLKHPTPTHHPLNSETWKRSEANIQNRTFFTHLDWFMTELSIVLLNNIHLLVMYVKREILWICVEICWRSAFEVMCAFIGCSS